MTTASQLIKDAYREGNLIPIAREPTATEISDALPRLNTIIPSYFGYELGEKLEDWNVPDPQRTDPINANYPFRPGDEDKPAEVYTSPPSNVRTVFNGSGTIRVYLQQQPEDGARLGFVAIGAPTGTLILDGNGRAIEGALSITLTGADLLTPREWFYRADLGSWVRLTELTVDDDSPFPREFDDLLIIDLARRLAGRNGVDIPETSVQFRANLMQKMVARYRQHPRVPGKSNEIPPSWQSYLNGEGMTSASFGDI